MGSSTPTTSSPPLPGQHSPFPQRQTPSSRVKHWEMGQKVTGTIWNGDPENWPSRNLILKHKWRRSTKAWFLFLYQIPKHLRLLVTSLMNSDHVSSPGNLFCRQPEFFTNLSESSELIVRSKTQNLNGLNADWQTELILQVICPKGEEEPGCLSINIRKQSVKGVCPDTWTAVWVAVPLWHQLGGEETGVVLPHCVPVFVSTHLSPNHFRIYWNARRKEKYSETVFY